MVVSVYAGYELALSGRLDVRHAAEVRDALHHALDSGTGDLVVDVSGVELVDATGLGVIVSAHRRADRLGRRLVLQRVPPRIDRLLTATRLNRVLVVQRVIDLTENVSA